MLRLAIILVLASARPATADPSERSDRDRLLHFGAFAIPGIAYIVIEAGFHARISGSACVWCEPTRLDVWARGGLKWDNVDRANDLSNLGGFIVAPLFALGAIAASSGFDDSRRVFDDVIPVLQAGIAAGVINETSRMVIRRSRPYVRFKGKDVMGRPGENFMSFFSGHTALDFALAASAGTVASLRDYRSAPIIWTGGLALAFTTAYLRVAADAHYLTDVTTGAILGSAIGLAVPLLFHKAALTDEARATPRTGTMMFSFGSRF